MVAKVAQAARPRYHISTEPELFYQREPYMNPDRGAGSHATRFISLGGVGNAAKAKWVHALALEPAATMAAADINAVPDQSTRSPYLIPRGQKRKVRILRLNTRTEMLWAGRPATIGPRLACCHSITQLLKSYVKVNLASVA